jgi:hypothetical protein
MEALAVVPPMSNVMMSGSLRALASAWLPMTPPAGPDSMMCIGKRAALASVVSPPFDCMRSRGAFTRASPSFWRSDAK